MLYALHECSATGQGHLNTPEETDTDVTAQPAGGDHTENTRFISESQTGFPSNKRGCVAPWQGINCSVQTAERKGTGHWPGCWS